MISSIHSFVRAALVCAGISALPILASAHDHGHDHGSEPGAVFTLSNAADANRVVVFPRSPSGNLTAPTSFPTGGKGTGAGLGDQGALALTRDGRWLLAVNAGSSDVSVFFVHRGALVLTDVVPSGGRNPISVTVADNLVYVLNAGGAVGAADNISGFYLTERGRLRALPGSTQALSAANVAPAQVSFARRGDVLIVTEKATNRVDTFTVDDWGRAGPVNSVASAGATPFGFAVSSRNVAFVSEAVSSALTSYRVERSGALGVITASRSNTQGAACWVVLSKDERYAYTANAVTNNLSGYRVAHDGSITLLDVDGVTGTADNHPLDMAVTEDGRFLYSLNTGSHTIVGFRVGPDGRLTRVSATGGVPDAAAGLVAQ
jgi:6-phosphogluconolactonase (cycloisomerase 2 family)